MTFSNQEFNSFLNITSENFDQHFLSLSPRRSSSPRLIMSDHNLLSNSTTTSNLGSFRTRARAGTLPSRFSNNSNSSTFSPSFNPVDTSSLNFDSLSISSNDQISSTPSKTRLRSGSLLGLSESSSIWGETQHSNNSSGLNTLQNSSISLNDLNSQRGRISPPKSNLQSQIIEEHPHRVRAYSNNALINDSNQFYLQKIDEQQYLQDQEFLDPNRPRASTFQNGVQNSTPLFLNQQHLSSHSELVNNDLFLSNKNDQPLLLDNIDPRLLNWTSTYQDPALGPTNTLFLSNLPVNSVTPVSLANLLFKFGKILTVRVFQGDDSALIEFDNLETAMKAKAQLNYQELMPGFSCLVTFAKILPHQNDIQQQQTNQQQQQSRFINQPDYNSNQIPDENEIPSPDITNSIIDPPPKLNEIVPEINEIINELGINPKTGSIGSIIKNALNYKGFDNDFGPLPDPIPIREFDAPKLRETRKAIDSKIMSQLDIEELSIAILEELPELSSDYLGNTVVQKLFQFSSNSIKYIMLKEVSPYLAQMGIHKNGTWSAQKMISVADSPLQKKIVADSLRPYTVPLLNDQFGNYVIQCSLKFGSPWNDFIFETILAKFWLIAQNRFGARAVRACLESHKASTEQTAIISAAIVLHAEHLAINQNAALLITWFLDTCTLPNRHNLLAPRLIPHLAQLCSHKLASLTILKILNNRYEVEARNLILNSLFGEDITNDDVSIDSLPNPPNILEQVLKDNIHGATFVFKVLSNPQPDSRLRAKLTHQARQVLIQMNFNNGNNYQGYKRLLDEVGLANKLEIRTRTRSNSGARNNSNTSANGANKNGSRTNKSPQNPNQARRSGSTNGFRSQTTSNGPIFNSMQNQPQPDSFFNPNNSQNFSNILPQQNGFLENSYNGYESSFPQLQQMPQNLNNGNTYSNGFQDLNQYNDNSAVNGYNNGFPQQFGYGTAQF